MNPTTQTDLGTPASKAEATIAVPGTLTSAFLALQLAAGTELTTTVVPFDQILDVVVDGKADAGLVIHEGQLTYRDVGLHNVHSWALLVVLIFAIATGWGRTAQDPA